MPAPTILVTGATGTTGSALLRYLASQGIAARALTRQQGASIDLSNVETVVGDLGDPASLSAAFAGIEALYLNIVPGPDALVQIDNALAAAKAAGTRTVVKLSGLDAEPNSASGIIRLHAEADRRVRESGIDYAILRANSFFQNIESQLSSIRNDGQFFLPLGNARQSLIDVLDIAEVAAAVISRPELRNRDYDLTGPQALNFQDVAIALGKAFGRPVSYVPISNEAFASSLVSAGLPDAAATTVAELFAVFATGIYADPTNDVAEVLGRPAIDIASYAARLVD